MVITPTFANKTVTLPTASAKSEECDTPIPPASACPRPWDPVWSDFGFDMVWKILLLSLRWDFCPIIRFFVFYRFAFAQLVTFVLDTSACLYSRNDFAASLLPRVKVISSHIAAAYCLRIIGSCVPRNCPYHLAVIALAHQQENTRKS